MKKLALISLSLMAVFISFNGTAKAHVLVSDESNTKAAILHITPDDNPIAGSQSNIYFDVQKQLTENADNVKLSITDKNGNTEYISTKNDGSLVTASYVFPYQGVYKLNVIVLSGEKTYRFTYSQRVDRGAYQNAQDRTSHTWAEILLIASLVSLAVLLIIFINRMHLIAIQSKY